MTNGPTQRRFPRYTIVLPVLYTIDASESAVPEVGWTSNVSEGGACLELAERLDPSTILNLALRTHEVDIEAKAEVVWAAEPSTTDAGVLHGVTFNHIEPDQRQALRHLIRTKGQGRNAGVRMPVELTVLYWRAKESDPPRQGRTGDISRAGILLRLPEACPGGTDLEVTLQTSQGPLMAEGTIVWVEKEEARTPGELIRHGFRFTNIGWSSELALGHLLAGRL